MECSIDGCTLRAYARGWCKNHYARWHRSGDPNGVEKLGRPSVPPRLCVVEGCDRRVKGHGYCSTHYMRWRRHGDPLQGRKSPEHNTVKVCEVDGCEKPSRKRNMCPMHWTRWKKYGDPGNAEPHYGNAGERYITRRGYVKIWMPNHPEAAKARGRVWEHRYIMEQSLGRLLKADETVHHKNGKRDDNHIENLELWSSRHPKGQRIQDQVEFAIETLRRYRPDMLY